MTSESEVDALVTHMLDEFGRIDYAVNCAGVRIPSSPSSSLSPIPHFPPDPLHSTHNQAIQIGVRTPAPINTASVPEFQRIMDINVFGMFLCTRAQSAAMLRQDVKGEEVRGSRGVIVNMGSCSSLVATAGLGQYTTSKHAVLGLSRNAGEFLSFFGLGFGVVWVFVYFGGILGCT